MKPWAKEIFDDVVSRLPYIAVGDVWANIPTVGRLIEVARIEPEDGWPFPMVHYRTMTGERVCNGDHAAPECADHQCWRKTVVTGPMEPPTPEAPADLDPRMGAPMFLFGTMIKRGQGKRWPR